MEDIKPVLDKVEEEMKAEETQDTLKTNHEKNNTKETSADTGIDTINVENNIDVPPQTESVVEDSTKEPQIPKDKPSATDQEKGDTDEKNTPTVCVHKESPEEIPDDANTEMCLSDETDGSQAVLNEESGDGLTETVKVVESRAEILKPLLQNQTLVEENPEKKIETIGPTPPAESTPNAKVSTTIDPTPQAESTHMDEVPATIISAPQADSTPIAKVSATIDPTLPDDSKHIDEVPATIVPAPQAESKPIAKVSAAIDPTPPAESTHIAEVLATIGPMPQAESTHINEVPVPRAESTPTDELPAIVDPTPSAESTPTDEVPATIGPMPQAESTRIDEVPAPRAESTPTDEVPATIVPMPSAESTHIDEVPATNVPMPQAESTHIDEVPAPRAESTPTDEVPATTDPTPSAEATHIDEVPATIDPTPSTEITPITEVSDNKKKIFWIFVVLVAIVAVLVQLKPGSPDQKKDVLPIDIFRQEMDKVKIQFPNQREDLWKRSRIHLQRHFLISKPTEPVSLILTAGVRAEGTLRCLAHRLASALSSALDASALHLEGAGKSNQDSDLMKSDIDSQLQKAFEGGKPIAVIHRFDELPPASTLIFYRYCDHENAAFKKTFLIFTVLLEEEEIQAKIRLSEVEEMVTDHLQRKFLSHSHPTAFDQMDIDKYGGLWSRISHLILPVSTEQNIEQTGHC